MRVLVVDKDARVRRAVSALLEAADYVVVGVASAARWAPDLSRRLAPDVVVLEIDRRRGIDDVDVVAELVRRGRIVIAVCSAPAHRAAAVAAGAAACLDKDGRFVEDLANVVRAAAAGPAPPPPA
jgi:DNA-binding NarL/FixJ family response regulator